MNKTALVILVLFMGLFHSSSQKFGVEVSGGFSLSTSPELITSTIYTSDGNSFVETKRQEKIPFGMGKVGKLNFRYTLPKNMFLQAGAKMLSGNSNVLVYSDYISMPGQSIFRNKETKLSYNFLDVDLIFGVNHQLNDKMSLQLGAGPLLQSYGKISENTHEHFARYSEGTSEIEDINTELQTKTRFNTGVAGYLGLSYALNSRWDIALNSTLRMSSWIPERSEIVKMDVNGQDQLRSLSESQRSWTYANEISHESVDPIGTQPSPGNERIQYYIPNNQLDFSLGLRYKFGELIPTEKDAIAINSKKMFIDYALGFGIGLSRTSFYQQDIYTRLNQNESSIYSLEKTRVIPFSYGSGVNGRIGAGIYVSPNLAVEFSELFNFSYFTVNNKELNDYEFANDYLEEKIVYSGQLFRSLIGVRIEYPIARFSPFLKTGISIGYGGNTKWRYQSDFQYNSEFQSVRDRSDVILKNYGGASLGAYSGIGASLKMNENMHWFIEGLAIAQNYSPTKGTILKAQHNGENLLPGLSKSEREIEYEDQVEYSGGGQNPNIPTKLLRFSEPFSSLMIQLGVRYSFPLTKPNKTL